MKDLASCIEFVEHHSFVLSAPGFRMLELYAPLYEAPGVQIVKMPLSLVKTITYHRFFKKNLDFWTCVSKLAEKYITREIKLMLRAKLAGHHRDGVVDNSLWKKRITPPPDFDPDYFRGKVESTRDPPLVFIPIPKLESSNGCARSDLPIRSPIFSERIPM
ncbi:hypothetical protein [Microcoleus sp. MON2_D5]|uniref:hypothetical protein n=1 Tax=Microcoleus sp. MON2_D5 TaxID=2818833 RepID=UPI002FD3269F